MLPVLALVALGAGLLALRGRPTTAAAAPPGDAIPPPGKSIANPLAGQKTYLREWARGKGYALLPNAMKQSAAPSTPVENLIRAMMVDAEQERARLGVEAVFAPSSVTPMLAVLAFTPPINGESVEVWGQPP